MQRFEGNFNNPHASASVIIHETIIEIYRPDIITGPILPKGVLNILLTSGILNLWTVTARRTEIYMISARGTSMLNKVLYSPKPIITIIIVMIV